MPATRPHETRSLETKSAARIAFDRWLRTGLVTAPPAPGGLELKFNPNHDERGRFTFSGTGAASGGHTPLKPIRGYPQEGKDSWRKANDAVFMRAATEWNASQGLQPGDERYMTPQFMKAWAMVESGGDKHAFLTDPFQVNNPGDWPKDDSKLLIGLSKGQLMTPDTSAHAALQWLKKKSYTHAYVGVGLNRRILATYLGIRPSLVKYNGSPHREQYADKVLSLARK